MSLIGQNEKFKDNMSSQTANPKKNFFQATVESVLVYGELDRR